MGVMENPGFSTLRKSVPAVCLIAAWIALVASSPTASAQGRAAAVLVDTVEQREVRDTQPVIGRLVATRRADIATRIAGIVSEVTFKVGNKIAAGQALLKLDASRLEIERRAAESAVAAAEAAITVGQAKLKLAEQAFERQETLRRSTAFSRSRYDDLRQAAVQSRAELGEAAARLQIAKVGLERAQYSLTHTVIKAPFDGVVVARQAQPGQFMQAGGTIATLLDISDLEVAADVPGGIANGLQPGTSLTAVFGNSTSVQVTVRTAIPLENQSTRTRPVRFTIVLQELKDVQIAVGGSVTLQVPVSAPRDAVTVPKDALLRGRDGWIVFVVQDNKATPRPVALGQAVLDRMEVTSGLKAGEVVVVRGNERLRPGQAVRPTHVAKSSTAKEG